jgi:hypothetical protein
VSELLVRAPAARVFERHPSLFVMDPRGALRRLDGDSAHLARAVLELLIVPRTREELFVALAVLVGGPVEPAAVVDELIALLRQCGAVVASPPQGTAVTARRATRPAGLRVVLGVTGAVQSIHTPALAALLLAEGHDVRVAMTANALRFCRPEGLEALTHNPTFQDLWDRAPYGVAPHVRLAEWADLVLIAPASASTIARLAAGACDDPVSAVAITTRAPVMVAPSMNVAMIEAPAVRRNLERLREDGFAVVHPTSGHEVAHGPDARSTMRGTMPPPHELVAIVRAFVSTLPARRETEDPALPAWDARYAEPVERRPWEADTPDAGLAEWLIPRNDLSRPPRALDLGCGTGRIARHLAARGFEVTAVDGSARAISEARRFEGSERVRWVVADALAITLDGAFDLVHDRALLHVLTPAKQHAYARRIAGWLAPGGTFVLTAHCEHTPASLGTHRLSLAAVAALFDGLLTVQRAEPCEMKGPDETAVPARRYLLTR